MQFIQPKFVNSITQVFAQNNEELLSWDVVPELQSIFDQLDEEKRFEDRDHLADTFFSIYNKWRQTGESRELSTHFALKELKGILKLEECL